MKTAEDQIYELHAGVCAVLSSPTRLKVLNALRDREVSVTELARRVRTSKPNLSQHLAVLRQRRVVLSRRQGVIVHYRLANPKILQAFDIMREVLFGQLSEGRRLYRKLAAAEERPAGPCGKRRNYREAVQELGEGRGRSQRIFLRGLK